MEIGEECQRNFSWLKEHHAKIQIYYPTRFFVTHKNQNFKKKKEIMKERERERGGEDHVKRERERVEEK